MWTSNSGPRPARLTPRWRALEASGLAALFALTPALMRSHGPMIEPNPAWIAVLVLAARDGSSGLLAGLIACAVAIGGASLAAGTGLMASYARLASPSNLVAFAACLAVSWVAAWQLRRLEELDQRLRESSHRADDAETTIDGLRAVVARLRERVDRASTSLSFLREVATRLDGHDPVAAAEAAADLAIARTGASAAAIKVGGEGFRRLLAVRDARGPRGLEPLRLQDADLTVPIGNAHERIGVVALWGVPSSGLDDATAHDLGVIASWCTPALVAGACAPKELDGSVRSVS
jgi:uncharacterized coiled-coil protein SlyX